MTQLSPLITLGNGTRIPALGLGVFQSSPADTSAAVSAAIEEGYRLIDTAKAYGNEHAVGDTGLRAGPNPNEIDVDSFSEYA
jgi:diketogulonate reductase-like aldo/keto reductase